jgi:regulator of replication initiation timing
MHPIIEQIALDKKISFDDAAYILNEISGHLVRQVPALQQVIEDIFENADQDLLNEHLNKMISLLQQRSMESFKTWRMPPLTKIISSSGIDGML